MTYVRALKTEKEEKTFCFFFSEKFDFIHKHTLVQK